jgi:glyoxylase-like metal-dependent hydrolase (beta-lactamase superfamily II)
VETLTVGQLLTNCYVAWGRETSDAIVIDPGFNGKVEADRILGILKANKLNLKFIVATHGHPDHISGIRVLKDATEASILIHRLDASFLSDRGKRRIATRRFQSASPVEHDFLEENKKIEFGNAELHVLHTPGHSPGSISLVGDTLVFTGDTLFAGSIGRCDLHGGSAKDIMHSLRNKLMNLPNSFIVYPGHGPRSTIEREKNSNPFLQRGFDPSILG